MKVTIFVRNFLTHHYLPLCLELEKRLGDNFKFVSQKPIFDWRLNLGFEDLDKKYDFVIRSYENKNEYNRAKQLAQDSDVVIVGEMTNKYIEKRISQNKLTLRYNYRILLFRDGYIKTIFNPKRWKMFYNMHIKYRKNSNIHLLAINGYAPKEFNAIGLYKNKIYKWGYFIEPNKYDMDELIKIKEKNKPMQIIWVARMEKWKHPYLVLKLARNLKKQHYDFKIQMLGTGSLERKIKKQIQKQNLEDVIEIVGKVSSDKVQNYMEKANIFIGTSDSKEGWGVTINEAMNTGCAIVANKNMGSVPFLITDNQNGMVYKNYQELENKVKQLLENKKMRKKLSVNAYKYITHEWSPAVAAENIIQLCKTLLNDENNNIEKGPASKIK